MNPGTENQMMFSKPLFGDPDQKIDLSCYILDRNHTLLNSFCETVHGISVKYSAILHHARFFIVFNIFLANMKQVMI